MKTNSYLVEYKIWNGTLRKEVVDIDITEAKSGEDIMAKIYSTLYHKPKEVYISQVFYLHTFTNDEK